jgi:hypothetical protein
MCDIAAATEAILEKVNPYPEAFDSPQAALKVDDVNRDKLPWETIRNRWGHLALAVLRYHREERHTAEFEKWTARLEAAFKYEPENLTRLSYEKCLFHLGMSDEASVRADLKSWPEQQQDPMWLARKAAVLIEIGEIQEATPLADNALRVVRGRRKDPNDFASMSREGWIMLLMYGLENHRWFSGQGSEPTHRGRWEYLKRYRCDPWAELEFFDERLKRLSLKVAPAVSRTFGFHPRTVTRSHHLGGDVGPDLRPAYQMMRLAEEAGCPPYFSHTTFIGSKLETIAGFFADTDPVRTHTLLCRLDSTDVVKRYLTRHRVAALSADFLKELTDVAVAKIARNEPKATGSERDPNDQPAARLARKRLATGLELLVRLTIRLSAAENDKILTLALGLYRSHSIRASLTLPKRLKALFESIVSAMTPDQVSNRLIDLMSLPIPGTADFSVQFPNDWPSVFELIPGSAIKKVTHRGPGWPAQIGRLIGILGDESFLNRGDVALRLHRLDECGLLTKTEVRSFAKALWKVRTPRSDLPVVHPCRQILVLRLPEPIKGIARKRMRTFMRSGDIPRVRTQEPGPDGRQHWRYKQLIDPDEFLLSWLHTTAVNRGMKKKEAWRYIDWRLNEIVELYGKIKKWFDDEGRAILALPTTSSVSEDMIQGPIRSRIETTIEVLRDVVFPRLGPEHRMAYEAVQLVNEMTTLGAATQTILPALIKYTPVESSKIEATMERGLVSSDEHVYLQSVRGLLFWLRAQGKGDDQLYGYGLPPVPPALVAQLCCNFTARRQPGLSVTLSGMSTLITECPGAVTPEVLRSIQLGLELIHGEATYRTGPDEVGPIPFDEVPRYRWLIAKLLNSVTAVRPSVPESLNAMKESYLNDPLPEVRSAFQPETDDSE